jgi:branched-chain amino acid transport system ATP-binding protein
MLEVSGVSVRFGDFYALRDVSLSVGDGEIVVLLGANGAGKSTLFRTISGLVRPTAGSVCFDGREIVGWPANAVVRGGIAQSPEGKHLFPDLSVRKNLVLGAYIRRNDRAAVNASLEEVYTLFPMLREKQGAPAGALSGGQQQMLSIGRALMAAPRLLLLDEPSLGLAPLVVQQVLDAISEINRRGTIVLLAEQNAHAALQIAHRGYVIENGEVALEGSREELLGNQEVRRAYLGV